MFSKRSSGRPSTSHVRRRLEDRILFDAAMDAGIDPELTEVLSTRHGLDAIHLISHGEGDSTGGVTGDSRSLNDARAASDWNSIDPRDVGGTANAIAGCVLR